MQQASALAAGRNKFQLSIAVSKPPPESESQRRAYNARAVKHAIYWAQEGDRILLDGNVVWNGYSRGDYTPEEIWKLRGENLLQTLVGLPSGTHIEIQTYRANSEPGANTPPGYWSFVRSFTLL
jgi:hypothetical protein